MAAAARLSERTLSCTFDLTFVATGEVVRDLEALVRGVLGAEGWPAFLPAADEADLIATLLGDAVVLERRYERRAGIEARPWLFQRLRWAARDWQRRHLRAVNFAAFVDHQDDDGSGSDGAPDPVAGDRGDDGANALGRLLESGDSALLREIEALGLCAPPGARARSAGADRWFRRTERRRVKAVAALVVLEVAA